MLSKLRIENLAVIESAEIVFSGGLNAITGETGSGKSVLIGALELALGGRGSAGDVRAGSRVAAAEATFDPPFPPGLAKAVRETLEIEWDPAEPLVLRRELTAQGRNRCLAAGQMINVAGLRTLGEFLADLHGQHEHQSLFRLDAQREALDAFGGHAAELAAYEAAHSEFRALERRRDELEARAGEFERRADYLDHQIGELERINPRAGELAELEAEKNRLAHAETLAAAAEQAHALLYEGMEDGPSAAGLLREARRRVEQIARLDPAMAPLAERIAEAEALAEDAAREVRAYGSGREPDPARLDEIIGRMEQYKSAFRKHGAADEAGLAAALARLTEERSRLGHDGEERLEIGAKLARAGAALETAASALSAARRASAGRLAAAVAPALARAGMERAALEIRVAPEKGYAAGGADRVEFLLAANPGEGFKPLRETASGGELSRTMLAIKTALAAKDAVPTLVFDEVDAGISGEAAARVGRLLEKLGGSHQILCITHHASIAARAGRHLSVRKSVRDGRTHTSALELTGEERLEELARMMGGDGRSEAGKKLARQLLAAGA